MFLDMDRHICSVYMLCFLHILDFRCIQVDRIQKDFQNIPEGMYTRRHDTLHSLHMEKDYINLSVEVLLWKNYKRKFNIKLVFIYKF